MSEEQRWDEEPSDEENQDSSGEYPSDPSEDGTSSPKDKATPPPPPGDGASSPKSPPPDDNLPNEERSPRDIPPLVPVNSTVVPAPLRRLQHPNPSNSVSQEINRGTKRTADSTDKSGALLIPGPARKRSKGAPGARTGGRSGEEEKRGGG